MKKNITIAVAICGLLFLASCDPQTCGTDFIENNSTDSIYLYHVDSVTVDKLAAGQVKSFEPVCGLGIGQSPVHASDYICVRSGDTISKRDIRDEQLWNSVKTSKYKWQYHFKVTDADFQP
jgi:hypothetical protein